MKACFQIAECSLFYVKIVQTSAMKACFQIAECNLFKAKIHVFCVTSDSCSQILCCLRTICCEANEIENHAPAWGSLRSLCRPAALIQLRG